MGGFRFGFLIPTAADLLSIFAEVLYRFIYSCQLTGLDTFDFRSRGGASMVR